MTPQEIASAINCLRCLQGSLARVLTLLLARWAGGSTDPQTIANASTPYQSFTGNEASAAISYLLSVINGGSTDPNTLSLAARCFDCLDGNQTVAQVYLLALITGSSTDPNDLSADASPFQGVSDFDPLILYLLSAKAGVSYDALAAAVPCWRCLTGEQERVQTYLLSEIQS